MENDYLANFEIRRIVAEAELSLLFEESGTMHRRARYVGGGKMETVKLIMGFSGLNLVCQSSIVHRRTILALN